MKYLICLAVALFLSGCMLNPQAPDQNPNELVCTYIDICIFKLPQAGGVTGMPQYEVTGLHESMLFVPETRSLRVYTEEGIPNGVYPLVYTVKDDSDIIVKNYTLTINR